MCQFLCRLNQRLRTASFFNRNVDRVTVGGGWLSITASPDPESRPAGEIGESRRVEIGVQRSARSATASLRLGKNQAQSISSTIARYLCTVSPWIDHILTIVTKW